MGESINRFCWEVNIRLYRKMEASSSWWNKYIEENGCVMMIVLYTTVFLAQHKTNVI